MKTYRVRLWTVEKVAVRGEVVVQAASPEEAAETATKLARECDTNIARNHEEFEECLEDWHVESPDEDVWCED